MFFEKVNEIKDKCDRIEGDFEQHLEELDRQFSLMCEDFKLLDDQEKTPELINKVINAEHVYHVVGVKLTEAILEIEPIADSIPCGQQEQAPQRMDQDPTNVEDEKDNQISAEITEKRLTYEQRRDVYEPLYRLRLMDSVNEG